MNFNLVSSVVSCIFFSLSAFFCVFPLRLGDGEREGLTGSSADPLLPVANLPVILKGLRISLGWSRENSIYFPRYPVRIYCSETSSDF